MKNLFVFFGFLCFFTYVSFAQLKKVNSSQGESSITYFLSHPMHEIEAISKEGVCRIEVDPTTQELKSVQFIAAVASFNSGNSNRDAHAMEVVDGITYPSVRYFSTNISRNNGKYWVNGKLTFHGITKEHGFEFQASFDKNRLSVTGSFVVSLTAYNVERPSLLMIPVKDDLKFTFTEVFYY